MREWQVGDPIGDGNDIGVPDIPYMDYLKNSEDDEIPHNHNHIDTRKSKELQEESWKLREKGNLSEALRYINSAIYYNPNDDENWNIKGIILWDTGKKYVDKFYEAVKCFDNALLINPNGKTLKRNKAMCIFEWEGILYQLNDFDEAMVKVNEALSLIDDKKSDDYAYALNLKSCIHSVNFNYDEALECVNKALEIFPNNKTFINNKESYIKNGHITDEDTLCDMADYNIKLGNDKKSSKYYRDLGFKFEYGDTDAEKEKAVDYYKKALEINPNYDDALLHLGYTLKDLKKYREAIPYFKRVSEDTLFSHEWHIADCYRKMGEYESAIHYLDKCIDESPRRHDWVEQKVECLLALNKTEEAIKVFSDFSNYLKNEGCYFESIKYIDEILKIHPNDQNFLNKKEEMLKNEKTARLYNLLNIIENTERVTCETLEEKLKLYIEKVSEASGESIEDILILYQQENIENYDFKDRCLCVLPVNFWDELISMYLTPENQDHTDSPTLPNINNNSNEQEIEKYCPECGVVYLDLSKTNCMYCEVPLEKRKIPTVFHEIYRYPVLERDNYRCTKCGQHKDEAYLQIDYITPLSEGGSNTEDNFQTVCNECLFDDDNNIPKNRLNESNNNPLAMIKQAKELLDDGAITQDEYEILKKKYLGLINGGIYDEVKIS